MLLIISIRRVSRLLFVIGHIAVGDGSTIDVVGVTMLVLLGTKLLLATKE